MSVKIRENLWLVGGYGLTNPEDAAVYLIRFGDKAALIDAGCGKGYAALTRRVTELLQPNAQLEYLLLTHCHYDHSGGAAAVRDEFGCRIVAHELDAVYLESGDTHVTAASWYMAQMRPFPVDVKLRGEGNTIQVGDGCITALHLPGHSPGSLVYTTQLESEWAVFGQDVHGPIHPTLLSDADAYQRSLAKLLALDADLLLEGHFGIIETKLEIRRFIRSYMK